MDKATFQSLCKQAGFKRKYDLALALGLSYNAVNCWGSTQGYPKYIEPFLRMAIKARKYDELASKGLIPQELLES